MKKLKYVSYFEDYKKLKSNLFDSKKYFKDSDDYKILWFEDKDGDKLTRNQVDATNEYYTLNLNDVKIGVLYNQEEIVLKCRLDASNVDNIIKKCAKLFFTVDHDPKKFDNWIDFFTTGEIDNKDEVRNELNKYVDKYYNIIYSYVSNNIEFEIDNVDNYKKEIINNLINNEDFIDDVNDYFTKFLLGSLYYGVLHGERELSIQRYYRPKPTYDLYFYLRNSQYIKELSGYNISSIKIDSGEI